MKKSECNDEKIKLTVISWGEPTSNKTFSGIARNITSALSRRERLGEAISYKSVGLANVFDGAVRIRFRQYPRIEINRDWMWSPTGRSRISRKISGVLDRKGIHGPVLQIGTLADLEPSNRSHFMLTDMTVKQAIDAGQFAISSIWKRHLERVYDRERFALSRAAHVFTLSEWARKSVIDDFYVDASKVTTVYAGSNLEIEDIGISFNPRGPILFVGIDWERKGGPLLLEAFRKLRESDSAAELMIIGCDPKISMDGVHVLGFLDKSFAAQREKLFDAYRNASCFCLPSVFDPFPIVLLEAASVGLPCVSIDNGSRREAIIDGQTGLLCSSASPDELCAKLAMILQDPEGSRLMGTKAKERAAGLFTWDHVITRILEIVDGHELSRSHPSDL